MFAGCIELTDSLIGQKLLSEAKKPNGLFPLPENIQSYWQDQTSTFIQSHASPFDVNPQQKQVVRCADTGVIVVGWMRLDNTKELQAKIPNARYEAAEWLILSAYKHWGAELGQHLIGDFALAIYDPRNQLCLLLRDPLGVRPLFYFQDHKCIVFASCLSIFQRLDPVLTLSVSEPWLCKYLFRGSADWQETAFQNLYKVSPAHCLKWTGGKVNETRYFSFQEKGTLNYRGDQDYVDHYRELFQEAVRCRISTDHKIAAESSGGLDSSSVIVTASQIMEKPREKLYCYGFAEFADEPGRIISVNHLSRAHSTQIFHYQAWNKPLTPDEVFEQFSQTLGAPFNHPAALIHYPIYRQAAKSGCKILLSGFGGDEFVTHQSSEAVAELLLQKKYALWLSRQKGPRIKGYLRLLKQLTVPGGALAVDQAEINVELEERWQSHIFKPEVCDKYGLQQYLNKHIDWPAYEGDHNAMLLARAWRPTLTARLEEGSQAAAFYGLEYAWPMLDIRLIQFFLRTPVEQRYGPGGVSRYLHRRALAPYLPSGIGAKVPAEHRIHPNNKIAEHPLIERFSDLAPELKEILDKARFDNLKERRNYALLWHMRLHQLNLWLKQL